MQLLPQVFSVSVTYTFGTSHSLALSGGLLSTASSKACSITSARRALVLFVIRCEVLTRLAIALKFKTYTALAFFF